MKKSLIALAAFAAVASAQADVTIYGNLDPSVVVQKMTTSSGGYTNAIGTSSAMDKSSQLGFKGAEDIGGGMKVIFDLQGDLTLGTGLMGNSNSGNSGASTANVGGNPAAAAALAPSADVFNRNAYVGLQTNSGTLKVGRQFTPFHEDQVNNDAFGMNSGGFLAVMSQLTTTGAGSTGTNFLINQASQISAFGNGNVGVNSYGSYANGLSFELPAMNGLTLKVFQTLGETALTSTNADKSLPSSSSGITSIKAVYDVNPALKLNAAWQTTRAGVAGAANAGNLTGGASTNLTAAETLYINSLSSVKPGQQVFSVAMYGGQYTMGQFRFTLSQASLQQFVAGFDNVGVTHAGVLYSMSPVVDLGLEYTSVKDKTATADTANITAVLGRYKLSKTTYVWGMYNTTGNSGNSVMNGNYSGISTALTTAGTSNSSFSSGISYSF